MDQYEREEYEKFMMVIKAALKNKAVTGGNKIRVATAGSSPSVSFTIEAYVLIKFMKVL